MTGIGILKFSGSVFIDFYFFFIIVGLLYLVDWYIVNQRFRGARCSVAVQEMLDG
jgi:hypothetical protein